MHLQPYLGLCSNFPVIFEGTSQSSREMKNFEVFGQDNSINMAAEDRQRTCLYLKLNSKYFPLSRFQNFRKFLKLVSIIVQISIIAELLPLDIGYSWLKHAGECFEGESG